MVDASRIDRLNQVHGAPVRGGEGRAQRHGMGSVMRALQLGLKTDVRDKVLCHIWRVANQKIASFQQYTDTVQLHAVAVA